MTARREIEEFDLGVLKSVLVTDQGNARATNEDSGRIASQTEGKKLPERGCLLVVADGIGGNAAGEVASKIAADTIVQEYFKRDSSPLDDLEASFQLANDSIFEKSITDKFLRGMGTTCTALVVTAQAVFFAHVGDTRAYLLKDGKVLQLTSDHTYVNDLVKKGVIDKSDAKTHPRRNVLTKAMGLQPDIPFDSGEIKQRFEIGDRLLICSDGLVEYLDDDELAKISAGNSVFTAAVNMVDVALRRGGHDNITVIIAEKQGS